MGKDSSSLRCINSEELRGHSDRAENGTVLVVDDCHINRTILKRQLEPMGYQVQVARSGKDALEQLSDSQVDLVFMDCQMPEMDGYEATRLLRQREGQELQTVVVAMTANTEPEHRARCLAAGMNDYLNKPVSRQTLLRTLEQWLSTVD